MWAYILANVPNGISMCSGIGNQQLMGGVASGLLGWRQVRRYVGWGATSLPTHG